MRFSCDECGRSYVASDEVAGRAFRMRCKQCGSELVIRPPDAAPSPFFQPAQPTPAPVPEGRREPGVERSTNRTFDPFEGLQAPEGDTVVSDEALEILERTPPPRAIPPAPPAAAAPASREPPARSASATTAPRGRAGRMLPAEDEAMLGPPGAEDRRSLPRWLIVLAIGALAAAGGFAYLR